MRTLLLLITAIAILPHYAMAQGSLINIPGVGGSGFDGYINAVYAMFISIAALLAVVKLIIAGVKYMFSDVITQKSDAKRDIQGALLGLLVVLSAVLILTVINPNLTGFNLSGVTTIDRAPATGATGVSSDVDIACQAIRDGGGECGINNCEYFETNNIVTWVVNDPINRALCSTFCNGTIIGRDSLNEGICVYEKSDSIVKPGLLESRVSELSSGESYIVPCTGVLQNGRCSEPMRCLDASHTDISRSTVTLDEFGVPTGVTRRSYITCTLP